MTSAERSARDAKIVTMRVRGMPERQVAEVLDCDRSTVQRTMRDFRSSEPQLRTADPLDVIDAMLEGYQADLGELAMVSQTTKNEAVRVGAVNARMNARDRIIALLQATGVLPHDLGKLSVEIDVRYISTRVVAVLNKYDVPVDARREMLAILRGEDPESDAAALASAN